MQPAISFMRLFSAIVCAGLAFVWTPSTARAQTPQEIVELARGLKGDPDLIFEYVHDNIQTLPLYGSFKGPLGALLDRNGTAFDQAELMVALLEQSGFTAKYVTGQILLTEAQYTGWLGTDSKFESMNRILFFGGFNYAAFGTFEHVTSVAVSWAWVQVTIGGTNYVFDPATKNVLRIAGIGTAAIRSAAGYDRTSFLSSAALVTTSSPWAVTSMDRAATRSNLGTYAKKLVQHIRDTVPAAGTAQIIGGLEIEPLPFNTRLRNLTLPNQYGSAPNVSPTIPAALRVTLTQQLGWSNSSGTFTALTNARTWDVADIYGSRMTVAFSGSSQASLMIDGVSQLTPSAVSVPANERLTVRVSISYPWDLGGGFPSVTNNDGTTVKPAANAAFALVLESGAIAGRALIERHRRLLQQNIAANPSNPFLESVQGEMLAMIGYTYATETSFHDNLIRELSDVSIVDYHRYGVAGMSTRGDATGPYVDFTMWSDFRVQRHNRPNSIGYNASETNVIVARTLAASVSESAVIEQTQPGAVAVSTVKFVDKAVQSGTRIFDINNGVITGDNAAYYTSTIRPLLLSGGWSTSDLAKIDGSVSAGRRQIVPEDGSMQIDLFIGGGYFGDINPLTDAAGSYISGGLGGGATGSDVPLPQAVPNTAGAAKTETIGTTITSPIESKGDGGGLVGATKSSGEPINLITGDYFLSTADLSIGSQAFPVGLAFQRYYDSGRRSQAGPLGLGWTHNFVLSALRDSDPFEGLGANSPINGAAAIVGTLVALDIVDTGVISGRPADRFVLGSVIYNWLAEQLVDNVVAVRQPGYVEHFVKLTDGSYNPPAGSGATLKSAGTAFTYIAKDQTRLQFNADGTLASWAAPTGQTMTLVYAGSPPMLSTVTNSFARSLSFAYQSNRIASVTDDAGRTVTFTYDSFGNLASSGDVLGQTTNYSYDLPGRMSQIFFPDSPDRPAVTNTYDSFSRVQTQTNINGGQWAYFFAGSRSEEVDPFGTRHVLYNTLRGKTRLEVQDFDPAKATNQQILTTNVYDSLDRLVQTTAPEGNSVSFTYDIASNPLTSTQTPKPGSPLSPLVTITTWDPVFNKPISVTDPRGLVTRMAYDSITGNLVAALADANGIAARTQYGYDSRGLLTSTVDPAGMLTQHAYDDAGNRVSTIRDAAPDGLRQTTAATYNARGDPVTITDPRGNRIVNSYDDARRLVQSVAPPPAPYLSGVTTAYTYDPVGRIIATSEALDGATLRTTSSAYTPSGKLARTTDPNGNITRWAYDVLDRRVAATDAVGRQTQYGYDRLSRVTSVSNAGIRLSPPLLQQAYTRNGQRATLTDANSNTSAFAYDGFDRLSTTTYPGGTTEGLTYDADSNVASRKTRAGATIAYGYDTLNRLIAKTPPSGPAVTYAYDRGGRLTRVSDDSAAVVAALPPGGTAVEYASAYGYDNLNRPTTASWSPTTAAVAPATGSSVLFSHTYNAANQRSGQTVTDNAWLAYPAATPSTTNYAANSLNQYTAVGAISPTYDGNGNLTSDGTWTLGYDAENRLTSASATGTMATYAYDSRGRRKSRTVNGTTTVFVTDADNREVLEYDGNSGAILRWHAYGEGLNDVLGTMDLAAGTRTASVPDLLGSVMSIMNAGTAGLTPVGYFPYGGNNTALAALPGFAYTGQRVDRESGFYYYRARNYSTAWGRFLQTDPIGYAGGVNLYAYVSNDPLNAIDPLGLDKSKSFWSFLAPVARSAPIVAEMGTAAALAPVVLGGAILLATSPFSSTFPRDTRSSGGDPESIFHRIQSPTQTPEVAALQVQTGEIWGATPRSNVGGLAPTVQAFRGPLPIDQPGIEFVASVPPNPGSGYPGPGGEARWYGGITPGVPINDQGYAVLKAIITKNTQEGR